MWILSAATHCLVNASWFQHGTMIDVKPRIALVLMIEGRSLRDVRQEMVGTRRNPDLDSDSYRLRFFLPLVLSFPPVPLRRDLFNALTVKGKIRTVTTVEETKEKRRDQTKGGVLYQDL